MKRAFTFIIFILLCQFLQAAEVPRLEERRRVEEQKRDSLRPSEAHPEDYFITTPEKEQEAPVKPLEPVDILYFTELLQRRIAYRYDACKVLVVLMGVEDEFVDLDSQVKFLAENDILPKKYKSDFDPMQPLRRGLAAYMFYKALEIKGGAILRIFGVSERYALKELAFEGIMAEGNTKDIVSGEELIITLTQSANYLAEKRR